MMEVLYFAQILQMLTLERYPYLALTFSINPCLNLRLDLAPREGITRTPEWCNFDFLDLPGSVDTGDTLTMIVVDALWPLHNVGSFQ